jgi:dolichol-phosphate mannosyltransferase
VLRWGFAVLVLARLARGRRRRAPLTTAAPPPAGSVSVVVPARDEEARLGPCLAGLRAQGADVLEVIVVDDGSSDGTAAVARAGGARVVEGAELPPGWAGKVWALEQGLQAARGDWVLFLDADTRPAPGLVRALVHAARRDGLDLVSCAPRYALADPLARALHASMTVTIVWRLGPLDTPGWQPSHRTAVLNGQCILARREPLLAAGGWARVRGHLTEDSALARALRAAGWRIGFADGTALLEVEPYETARETWTGWGRSLVGPDTNSLAHNAFDLATLWLTLALPLPRLLARRGGPADVAMLAARLALLGPLAGTYRPRGAGFWLSPLADLAATVRLTQSALRPTREWRGRTY